MERKYKQTYRSEWEQNPQFSSWLCKKIGNQNEETAFCKFCNAHLIPRLASIKEHLLSKKHLKNMSVSGGSSKIDKYFKQSSLSQEIKKAEIRLVAFLLEHNIPFRAMDHLSVLLREIFHDSEIAKNFSCKRTKSAAVSYNVIGHHFEKQMLEDLKSGNNAYSIIIDESTDISTTKILAIAIKFFSEKYKSVQTRFLCAIDIQGETAQNLFDALNCALIKRNIKFEKMIGFAADTTNVMFGERAGVISKIRAHNESCVFIKCVCHSIALSVSYACKIFPRSIDQMVRDVYNHFSQSCKRQREFMEFQNFMDLEKHKILRHYDIRWLSLYSCVNRILEQWPALKLFFQGQYLEDKRQNVSSEFLFNCFNDDHLKLYFYFLDFILPITNKFNLIFQGDYPVVHRIYRDMTDLFNSLLGCYMKSSYITSTSIQEVDPKNYSFMLPLERLYLGINVSKHLTTLKGNGKITPEIEKAFLGKCQLFLIELCQQLKTRLPTDDIFRILSFLDPQVACYNEFSSFSPLFEKFPNIISQSSQSIDNEYRTMKLDLEVLNLLKSKNDETANVNVEDFWVGVGGIMNSEHQPKYHNVSAFAKKLLCLPLSNAKCERIFSAINRIKTKDRNRFLNTNIASILHAKEGLKEVGDCCSFQPTKNMVDSMTDKYLYRDVSEVDLADAE